MNSVFALLTIPQIAIGGGVFLVVQTVVILWFVKRLNTDPLDDHAPLGPQGNVPKPLSGTGDAAFQTSVATPRPRRLQPAPPRTAEEIAADEQEAAARGDVPIPADSLAAALAKPPESAPVPVKPAIPAPAEPVLADLVLASAAAGGTPEKTPAAVTASETLVPAGALIMSTLETAGTKLPAPAPAAAAAPKEPIKLTVPEPVLAAAPKEPLAEVLTPEPVPVAAPKEPVPIAAKTALPPLAVAGSSLPKAAGKPGEVAPTPRKFFAPLTPAAPTPTPANPLFTAKAPTAPMEGDKGASGVPPRWSVVSSAAGEKPPTPPVALTKPAAPEEKSVAGPADAPKAPMPFNEPSAGLTLLKPSDTPPAAPSSPVSKAAEAPKVEPVSGGLIAISQPVVPSEETDDVKKKTRRTTPAPEPAATSGLILIPPVEAKPAPAEAKAAEPAAKVESKAEDKKTTPEPVLSPGVSDAPPATPPTKPEVETKNVKGPRVFLPGKFFGGAKSKEKEAAAIEAKAPQEPAAKAPEPTPGPAAKQGSDLPKITTPPFAPALVVPPVEEVPAAKAPTPEAKPGSVVPESKEPSDARPDSKLPEPVEAKAVEPVADKAAEPAVSAPEAKPEPVAAKTEEIPEPKEPVAILPEEKPATPTQPEAKTEAVFEPKTEEIKPEAKVTPEPLSVIPEAKSEPLPEATPEPEKPAAKTEILPEAKPEEVKPEAKAETVPEPGAAKPEAKTEAVPEPKPEVEPAKPEEAKPEAKAEAVAPESKPEPEATKPEAKAEPVSEPEPAVEPEPEPVAPVAEKPAEPAAPVAEAPKAPVAPEHSLVASVLPTQAAPTAEPIAEPLVSIITPSAPAPTPVSVAEARPTLPAAAPITQPPSVMPDNETTTNLPNNGRASAQLILGFEITSLQLTPFFKLGSVQLKALSNVVTLHLIAAQQQENPLAASIAFQIDHVELDGASHLKSILLKPLGESREATAPLPKLQVDNVAIGAGGEGGPISVTTSSQASTTVQLFGTFTIAAMDFTPAFEIGSLRLEPTSNTVLLRVAPSSRPTALDLPPSFEVAQVQLGDGAQISGVRLTPSGAK